LMMEERRLKLREGLFFNLHGCLVRSSISN
jgi:hypothetical protein